MSKSPKVAIILSGNGVYDGAEIHESTMTMLAINKQGGSYDIFAPDIDQHHVINHITGEEMNEKRNVLVEAARIARGSIKPLSELAVNNYDALILPGGFGAAKNLSNFAFKGADAEVLPELEKVIKDAVEKGKPIGALCITPAVIAKILKGVKVTIGQDEGTAQAIQTMGGEHVKTGHGEVTIDKNFKVATTPCYMLDASISDIALGAENVTKAVFEMI
jgi:enhancing lycopene biosynthesis protein 2